MAEKEGVVRMKLTDRIKEQFNEHPIRTTTTIIALPTALIALLVQVSGLYGNVSTYIDEQVVSEVELNNTATGIKSDIKSSETRIIENMHKEAIKLRQVYIADLVIRVERLNQQLRKATTPGTVKYYSNEVSKLNKHIAALNGMEQ